MPAGNPQPGETWHDVLRGFTVQVNNVDGRSIHFTGPGIAGSRPRVQFLSRHYFAGEPCGPRDDLGYLLGAHQHYLEQEASALLIRTDVLNALRAYTINPRILIECSRGFGNLLDAVARSYGTPVAFTVTSEDEGFRYQVIGEDSRVVNEDGVVLASDNNLRYIDPETGVPPTQTAPEPEVPTLWERLDQEPTAM
jgi:hypothetical protein